MITLWKLKKIQLEKKWKKNMEIANADRENSRT